MSLNSDTNGVHTFLKRRKGEYYSAYEIGRKFKQDKGRAAAWARKRLEPLVEGKFVDQQEDFFGVKQ